MYYPDRFYDRAEVIFRMSINLGAEFCAVVFFFF